MRLTTALSVLVLGVSAAALAQVGQAPVEQKLGQGNDVAIAENAASPQPSATPSPSSTDAAVNQADAAPPAGEPTEASSAPPKR